MRKRDFHGYSVKKHQVKTKFPDNKGKERITTVGASVYSPRFSVNFKEDVE